MSNVHDEVDIDFALIDAEYLIETARFILGPKAPDDQIVEHIKTNCVDADWNKIDECMSINSTDEKESDYDILVNIGYV